MWLSVCLCLVTLRAHLPVIAFAFPVFVLSCKRKPAGLRRIAEALRTVTRRVTGGGLQVGYRGRASLGRRHDKLVWEHSTGSLKSGVRRSTKEEKRGRSSRHQCGGILQKSGTQIIPQRTVFGQGLGLNDPFVQRWRIYKGRL